MTRRNFHFLKDGQGNTLVEFALVVPILLLLVVGTLDLGWAAFAGTTIALAASEGARQAVVRNNSDSVVRTQVQQKAQGLDNLQITINPPGNASSPYRSPGETVSVTVVYTYTPITPLIAVWGGGRIRLSSTSTMRVE